MKSNRWIALILAICIALPTVNFTACAGEVISEPGRWDVWNPNGVTGADIVEQARSYRNCGRYDGGDFYYRTGYATTIPTFDCSGFVCRVTRDLGLVSTNMADNYPAEKAYAGDGYYYITSNTHMQKHYGRDLSEELQRFKNGDSSGLMPGDLIFFDYGGDKVTDHVAIYAGNGNVIESLSSAHPWVEWPMSYELNLGKSHTYFAYAACRLVDPCDHTWSSSGFCTNSDCGIEYNYQATYDWSTAGTYTANKKSNVLSRPYAVASKLENSTFQKGATVTVLGSVTNAFEAGEPGKHRWYKVLSPSGEEGYIHDARLDLKTPLASSFTCNVTSPKGDIALNHWCVVSGTVHSDRPISRVRAWVEDSSGNVVTAISGGQREVIYTPPKGTKDFDLKDTVINSNLIFDYLSVAGSYKLKIVIEDDKSCSNPFVFPFTAGGGTHTCTYGNALYETAHPHRIYETCSVCGETQYTGEYQKVSGCADCAAEDYTVESTHTVNTRITVPANYDVPCYAEATGIRQDTYIPKQSSSFYIWATKYVVLSNGLTRYYYQEPNGNCWYFDLTDSMVATKWYRVTYDTNNGSGTFSSQKKFYGQSLTLHSDKPTRAGYTFLGWSTSKTATSATYSAGGKFNVNKDTTLYAVWKRASFTVTYNANGGTGAPEAQSVTSGTFSLSSKIPERFPYQFLGWCESAAGDGDCYGANAQMPAATRNLNLYAKWEKAMTISTGYSQVWRRPFIHNANSIAYLSFTPEETRVYAFESEVEDDSDPRAYLYTESGMLLAQNDDASSTTRNFQITYQLEKGTTYYFGVRWFSSSETGEIPVTLRRQYTITYDPNGGVGAPAVQTGLYRDQISLFTNAPIRSGYTFLGWCTNRNASSPSYKPGDKITLNSDKILYAVWQEDSCRHPLTEYVWIDEKELALVCESCEEVLEDVLSYTLNSAGRISQIKLTGTIPDGLGVYVASYSSSGQMLDCQAVALKSGTNTVSQKATSAKAVRVHLFLTDERMIPLCASVAEINKTNFRAELPEALANQTYVSNKDDLDMYADAEKIDPKCEDAVLRMYNLNFMKGDGRNFYPEATASRAEFVKAVYLALNGGVDDGAAAYAEKGLFSNVDKDDWYAGYANYCASQGLIGTGRFYAGDPLTTLDAAKTLLCALGYSSEACGFTGANWADNVQIAAEEIGLFDHMIGLYDDFDWQTDSFIPKQWLAVMICNAIDIAAQSTSGN